MNSQKDYYQILGLRHHASTDDIKKAYRLYAAKLHPDKHAGDTFFEDRFKEVQEAYEILSDEEQRGAYDVKKFRRSKLRRAPRRDFAQPSGNESAKSQRLIIRISDPDVYIAVFYFLNLSAWTVINRLSDDAPIQTYIPEIFLCAVSTLTFWLFVKGVIEWMNGRPPGKMSHLLLYLLVSLAIAGIALWLS